MSYVVVFPQAQLFASQFFILLLTHIILDDVPIYPNRTGKIPSRPDMESPIPLTQIRKFLRRRSALFPFSSFIT